MCYPALQKHTFFVTGALSVLDVRRYPASPVLKVFESVLGKVERVHEVCEWRGENQKLIPKEWIE